MSNKYLDSCNELRLKLTKHPEKTRKIYETLREQNGNIEAEQVKEILEDE